MKKKMILSIKTGGGGTKNRWNNKGEIIRLNGLD
jgi:hypothetical protein